MHSLTSFDDAVWRILPDELTDTPSIHARAPEGRFHHSEQIAAYASLSAEGAKIAVKRYLGDGVTRKLVPMWLKADKVVDESGNRLASVIWQDLREAGMPSPTWAYSDAARDAGAQAMLYSSRSRPELTHVVVFDLSCLRAVGPALSIF